jgi:hypothetical protein
MPYISFFSTIITLTFAGAVFGRYLEKQRTHLLFWTIGLLFYGLGTLSEIVMAYAFDATVLRMWYFSGAMMTAAWLGQGTISLLVRKGNIASTLSTILLLFSLFALELVRAAPITEAALAYEVAVPISAQYEEIMVRNGVMVVLTILLNVYGTIGLVGGAAYSAVIFWRKRVLANRMWGNVLLATGAFMPALGGTFIRLGLPDWLYISELVGAGIMFAGYLQAIKPAPKKSARRNTQTSAVASAD